MNNLLFLLNAGLLLLLFTGFYYLVLIREKNFSFNRVFLLLAGILSLSIPLLDLSLGEGRELVRSSIEQVLIVSGVSGSESANQTATWNTPRILFSIWLMVTIVLLTFRLISYLRLTAMIQRGERAVLHGTSLTINPATRSAFSFIHTIVVPDRKVNPLIIKHEKAHVKGAHFIDLFFAELLCCIFWFIPFIGKFKKAVVLNHEFIADSTCITEENKTVYCRHILENTFNLTTISLSHAFFNQSLTKTRITMMYKSQRSKLCSVISYALIVPFLMMIIIISSGSDEIRASIHQPSADTTLTTAEVMPEYPGGQEAMFAYLSDNVVYPEKLSEQKVEGTVYIGFVVAKDGSIKNVEILRGVHEELDQVALSVIENMPQEWKPGTEGGQKVNVQITLPIRFIIKQDKD